MKTSFAKYLLISAMLLLPISAWSQKNIYTRSFQIQDFKSKTTKVVLGGSPALNASLRQEVTSLWTASPYEFCTTSEFNSQKNSPECYFLHPEVSKGIIYLTLSRGGDKNASDARKLPITVVSIPIAGENDESGLELVFMPAYISLLQDYTEAALNSEVAAYSGLKAIRKPMPKGTAVYSGKEAEEAFLSQYTGAAAGFIISPDGSPKSKPHYKWVIDTSSYALYHYGKN